MTTDIARMTPYEEFIATSRYARWLPEENRRESWEETVDRYIEFFREHVSSKYGVPRDHGVFDMARTAILNRDVMPSMRALMTAGPALQRSHMAGYNCSFVAIDHPRAFDEVMFILMNGTGVGFSVDRTSTDRLPIIPSRMLAVGDVIHVEDSREGWAHAFRLLIEFLYQGYVPVWDTTAVRPLGARLSTFGGRASGPGPLEQLFDFTVQVFDQAQGRKLSSLEVHDIICKVGDVVVSGGVRRSALISLSDLNDFEMAKAKSGNWWDTNGHRALANNSAIYDKRPTPELFLREWRNLIESQSGERGIFNRQGVRTMAPARRDGEQIMGTNPCGEIALRSMGLCNLTEVVIKEHDTEGDIRYKVTLASILGTFQSTLTDFHYVRPQWAENANDERLLGVSLTGIYGNRLFNNPRDARLPRRLEALRNVAVEVNESWAKVLGINPAAAVTTVKPSGTVSQLTGVSSGIHPWHSAHYIRTVRGANTDPLTRLMKDSGVPHEPDVMNPEKTTVFSFPVKAPADAVTRAGLTALQHLEMYRIYRLYWAEHQVSITVTVKPHEWIAVAAWVYENWNIVAGISFLPLTEHTYQQAPYQEIGEIEYDAMVEVFPNEVRYADLVFYEHDDSTTGARELACSSDNGCEVVDFGGDTK